MDGTRMFGFSNKPYDSLFALVIGINNYSAESVSSLLGALPDAEAIERYLKKKLGVPSTNITTLYQNQATRSSIIGQIRELARNPKIKRDDPILIYFAGHGSEAPAPKGWESQRSKVQLMIPYDYHTEAPNMGRVHGIPDRSLGVLLEELAAAKGNNIVVILDTCHAGSGTRKGARRVRCLETTSEIPEDLDYDIWSTAEANRANIPKEVKYYGDASHVLLAACASNQNAIEDHGRGIFTQTLLKTITVLGIKHTTYAHLIKQLPQIPDQNPRCEGANRCRFLFRTDSIDEEPSDLIFHEVKMENWGYVLQVGSIHGISEGSEFSLYKERGLSSKHLGNVTVSSTGDITSALEFFQNATPNGLPLSAFAVQTAFGKTKPLRVYVDNDPRLQQLRQLLTSEIKKHPHLYTFADREQATFEITAHDDDTTAFAFVNSLIDALTLKQLPFRVYSTEMDIIMKIIDAASVFNRYLTYQPLDVGNQNDVQQPGQPVNIHFTKLTKSEERRWAPYVPEGDNLNQNSQVDLTSGDTRYGLKITNNTAEGLYPYLFLFNSNELSIEPWYMSPTVSGEDDDPPLQPNGSITIGYGDGGGRPWRHVVELAERVGEGKIVRDEEDLQVEFFKLILTTQPFDFGFMKRGTPFDESPRNLPDPKPTEMRKSVLLTVITQKEKRWT